MNRAKCNYCKKQINGEPEVVGIKVYCDDECLDNFENEMMDRDFVFDKEEVKKE